VGIVVDCKGCSTRSGSVHDSGQCDSTVHRVERDSALSGTGQKWTKYGVVDGLSAVQIGTSPRIMLNAHGQNQARCPIIRLNEVRLQGHFPAPGHDVLPSRLP